MPRTTRYQGAIIRDHHILLLQQLEHAIGRSYWLVPGGGIEPGETEDECVRREMFEETCVEVAVERLLLDEAADPGSLYQRRKTYLCRIVSGEPRPGHEPEEEYATAYTFTHVGWFDLRHPQAWGDEITGNARTHALLEKIRGALGYTNAA